LHRKTHIIPGTVKSRARFFYFFPFLYHKMQLRKIFVHFHLLKGLFFV